MCWLSETERSGQEDPAGTIGWMAGIMISVYAAIVQRRFAAANTEMQCIFGYYSFEVGFEMSNPFLLQILIFIPVVFEKNVTIFESCFDSK